MQRGINGREIATPHSVVKQKYQESQTEFMTHDPSLKNTDAKKIDKLEKHQCRETLTHVQQ